MWCRRMSLFIMWALPHIELQLFTSRVVIRFGLGYLKGSAGRFWHRMFFPSQAAERDPVLSPLVWTPVNHPALMPTLPFWLTCEEVNTIAFPSVRLPVISRILIKQTSLFMQLSMQYYLALFTPVCDLSQHRLKLHRAYKWMISAYCNFANFATLHNVHCKLHCTLYDNDFKNAEI